MDKYLQFLWVTLVLNQLFDIELVAVAQKTLERLPYPQIELFVLFHLMDFMANHLVPNVCIEPISVQDDQRLVYLLANL